MKKFLGMLLLIVALFSAGLYADTPQYPGWEWDGNQWVCTGDDDDLDPLPPPPSKPGIG